MSTKKRLTSSALLGAAVAGSFSATTLHAAYIATPLVTVGDTFTGSSGSTTVGVLKGNVAVNQTGGLDVIITSAESTNNYYVYGKATGASSTGVIVAQSSVSLASGNPAKTFANGVGLSNAGVPSFEAAGTNSGSGGGYFLGTTPVAVSGGAVPTPSSTTYGTTVLPYPSTATGTGYFIASLSPTTTGAGVYKSTASGTVSNVLLSNTTPSGFVSGTAAINNSGSAGFGPINASASDLHYTAKVSFGSSSSNNGIVLDGSAASYNGGIIETGQNVGGTSTAWTTLDFAQVNDSGTLLVSGHAGGTAAANGVLAIGSATPVLYASSDAGASAPAGSITSLLDNSGTSHTLTPNSSTFQDAALNSNGDYAFLTTLDDNTSLVGLVFDGKIIAETGDPILANGDKVGFSINTIRNLAISDRNAGGQVTVDFFGFDDTLNASNTPGSTTTTLFSITVPEPASVTVVAAGLAAATLRRRRRGC